MARANRDILLKNVTLSYCNLVNTVPKMSGDGREYSVQLIIPKDHKQVAELQTKIKEVAAEAFPDKPIQQLKIMLRDSDAEGYGEKNEYQRNTFFANVRRQEKQGMVPVYNRRNERIIAVTEEVLFSGVLASVQLSIYSYDMPTAKGITASINAVQVVDNVNVERLGGNRDTSNVFEALDEDENPEMFKPAEAEQEEAKQEEVSEEITDSSLPWS